MADVRALLQSERAKRRITHPHATYTSDGKLQCNFCEVVVKSEAQWQSHLHSTQHNLRSQRAQDAKESRGVGEVGAGKKRKAETLGSPGVDNERKRARADEEDEADLETERPIAKAKENGRPKKIVKFKEPTPTATLPASTLDPSPDSVEDEGVDESELLALEADLAALEQAVLAPPVSALNAEATISAPAMSAEELAAQAREEQSSQKGKRDREIEDEREEAERALEEEFAEMEGFEERVRRLRERREALRVVSPELEGGGSTGEAVNEADGEEESDEEDGEEDEWGFGGA